MQKFRIDKWLVDPGRNTVSLGVTVNRIEPRAMDLLCYLAEHPGDVLGREQIIERVWPHTYVTDSALQTAISMLRKAFGDDPRSPHVIETIPKRGYRLIAGSSAPIPVLAVLPLENLTGSVDQQFLADGITDMLIAELGRFASIRVISRQSAMAFEGSNLILPEIARRLNATVVIEGSVLSDENGIGITVQLIDAVSDTHLWSDTYRSDVGSIFQYQQSTAARIVEQLHRAIDAESGAVVSDVNADAVMDYLRGRFHWYKLSPEHVSLALKYFEAAIEKEPGFGAAHAGIADACAASPYWGAVPASSVVGSVERAISCAEAADPRSAEVQMLAAAYQFYIKRAWVNARARIERAIALNPNLAHARMQHALFLATWNDARALGEIDLAIRLDPLNPVMHLVKAYCLAGDERFSEAVDCVDEALELNPALLPAREMRADLAWRMDDADALQYERLVWEADPEILAALSPMEGGDAVARLKAAARLLEARARSTYVMPLRIARLYALGDCPREAITVLSRAIDDQDLMQIDLLGLMPALHEARSDPNYRRLVMRRLGLPLSTG